MRKSFAGNVAKGVTLASGCGSSGGFTVGTGTGSTFPTGTSAPFVVVIARGSSSEEKVLCTRSGDSFTPTTSPAGRGWDGTSAISHSAGDAVEHCIDSDTINETNDHVNTTTRDDHTQYLNTTRHDVTARHAAGTVVPTAAPGASAPGDAASQGASASLARADHVHSREVHDTTTHSAGTVVPVAAPGASALGDTASAGSATSLARSDHRHSRESAATVRDAVLPSGLMMMYVAAAAPAGWVLCDGTSYPRTGGTYDALFAIIGTTYGAADGTHFNVPDMRGRVPMGSGLGTGGGAAGTGLPTGGTALTNRSLGAWTGAETVALSTANLASHAHNHAHAASQVAHRHTFGGGAVDTSTFVVPFQSGGATGRLYSAGDFERITFTNMDTATPAITVNSDATATGSGSGHENMIPAMTVNFIVKL